MRPPVDALENEEVRRIVLVRPAVEAGERLGFLPGDMSQKVDPYLRPMYDALYDMLGADRVTRLIDRNVIEIAPLAFMRGRSLNESFVILDEAQNTSVEQMKMFLTRIGFGSRAVVTGDVTQIDLPSGQQSGLKNATQSSRRRGRHCIHVLLPRKTSSGTLWCNVSSPHTKRATIRARLQFCPWTSNCRSRAMRATYPRETKIREWVGCAVAAAGTEGDSAVSVRIVDEDEMRTLNRDYRDQDKPTNVLSFPAGDFDGLPAGATAILGDIVVCAGIVSREATEQGKPAADHWSHMIVHGTLHLLGFDHMTEPDAMAMESLEQDILATLGIADPYKGN